VVSSRWWLWSCRWRCFRRCSAARVALSLSFGPVSSGAACDHASRDRAPCEDIACDAPLAMDELLARRCRSGGLSLVDSFSRRSRSLGGVAFGDVALMVFSGGLAVFGAPVALVIVSPCLSQRFCPSADGLDL
jgi:hypothetical protein